MGVDTGISGRAGQCLVLAVRYVLVSPGIAVLLGQTKVDDVHQISLLTQPHQEVVRLHVAVDEVLGVNVLQSTYLKGSGGVGHSVWLVCEIRIKNQWRKVWNVVYTIFATCTLVDDPEQPQHAWGYMRCDQLVQPSVEDIAPTVSAFFCPTVQGFHWTSTDKYIQYVYILGTRVFDWEPVTHTRVSSGCHGTKLGH